MLTSSDEKYVDFELKSGSIARGARRFQFSCEANGYNKEYEGMQ
jgi:hypothetical protein